MTTMLLGKYFMELVERSRPKGRLKLGYKVSCKASTKYFSVKYKTWKKKKTSGKKKQTIAHRKHVHRRRGKTDQNLVTEEASNTEMVCWYVVHYCWSSISWISHEGSCSKDKMHSSFHKLPTPSWFKTISLDWKDLLLSTSSSLTKGQATKALFISYKNWITSVCQKHK